METKQEIRRRILEKRMALPSDTWRKYSDRIAEKVVSHPLFAESGQIFCYISVRNEADTAAILAAAFEKGKQVAVPKVQSETEMQFFGIGSLDELRPGAYGILEPVSSRPVSPRSALVLMPGAVFDRFLHRVGYGGGYYDRYLAAHRNCRTMALAFSLQIVSRLPAEAHDIRPEYLVTESGIFSREGGSFMQTNIPKDPVMLLSFVNTKLRDFYPDLENLCEEMQVDREWVTRTLEGIDYRYDKTKNQFV